jgi:ParB-like chromosome segregation protein Spo0J
MAERTLIWDSFDYIFEAKRRRIKPVRTHPNPLLVALKYKSLLNTPGIDSQANLARKVGVSPARISQMLRLLKLPQEIQQAVIRMGDPLPPREVTERKLRAFFVASPMQ